MEAFAEEEYGLAITSPGGVRDVVRNLDLACVALPSVDKVIAEVVAWAK